MPSPYLFHYSFVIRKTRSEEETLISPTGFFKNNLVNITYIFLKHNKLWLNVYQSLSMDLFYKDNLHLIKERNELLAKEIMAFYKKLSSTIFNAAHISYKNMISFSDNNDGFPPLPSNGTSHQFTPIYIIVKPRERSKFVSFSNTVNPLLFEKNVFVFNSKAYMFPLILDLLFCHFKSCLCNICSIASLFFSCPSYCCT